MRLAEWVVNKEILGLRELQCADLCLAFPANPGKLARLRQAPVELEIAPPLIVRREENCALGVADGTNRLTLYRDQGIVSCWALVLRA